MTRNERNDGTMFPYNRKFPRDEKFIWKFRSVVPFVPHWLKETP